jgi:hypothetical protein
MSTTTSHPITVETGVCDYLHAYQCHEANFTVCQHGDECPSLALLAESFDHALEYHANQIGAPGCDPVTVDSDAVGPDTSDPWLADSWCTSIPMTPWTTPTPAPVAPVRSGYKGKNPRPQGSPAGKPTGGYKGKNPRPQGSTDGKPSGGYKGKNPRPAYAPACTVATPAPTSELTPAPLLSSRLTKATAQQLLQEMSPLEVKLILSEAAALGYTMDAATTQVGACTRQHVEPVVPPKYSGRRYVTKTTEEIARDHTVNVDLAGGCAYNVLLSEAVVDSVGGIHHRAGCGLRTERGKMFCSGVHSFMERPPRRAAAAAGSGSSDNSDGSTTA